ncbi:hypothetical protein DCS_04501 [Drechmeria coniospora]|uniref:Uncharacterized protein n=1 Tax=Drechmeria coniospora TaxID=98403 RepID=A0A151GKC7_DRECN|nr:hypothetical protein DCS_04501 [Drechmeria coniospora]KYK57491.1 hypothetical protein DCS_04501 [Drechmeria coniospora]
MTSPGSPPAAVTQSAAASSSLTVNNTPRTAPSSRRGSRTSQQPTLLSFTTPSHGQVRRLHGLVADETAGDQHSPQKGGHSLRKRARVDYTFEHVEDDVQVPSSSSRRKRRSEQPSVDGDAYDVNSFKNRDASSSLPPSAEGAVPPSIRRHPVRRNTETMDYRDDDDVQDTIEVGVSFSDLDASDGHASGRSPSPNRSSPEPETSGNIELGLNGAVDGYASNSSYVPVPVAATALEVDTASPPPDLFTTPVRWAVDEVASPRPAEFAPLRSLPVAHDTPQDPDQSESHDVCAIDPALELTIVSTPPVEPVVLPTTVSPAAAPAVAAAAADVVGSAAVDSASASSSAPTTAPTTASNAASAAVPAPAAASSAGPTPAPEIVVADVVQPRGQVTIKGPSASLQLAPPVDQADLKFASSDDEAQLSRQLLGENQALESPRRDPEPSAPSRTAGPQDLLPPEADTPAVQVTDAGRDDGVREINDVGLQVVGDVKSTPPSTQRDKPLAPPTITVSDTTVVESAEPADGSSEPASTSLLAPSDESSTRLIATDGAPHVDDARDDATPPCPLDIFAIPSYSASRLETLMQGRYAHLSPYILDEYESYPNKVAVTYANEIEEQAAKAKAAEEEAKVKEAEGAKAPEETKPTSEAQTAGSKDAEAAATEPAPTDVPVGSQNDAGQADEMKAGAEREPDDKEAGAEAMEAQDGDDDFAEADDASNDDVMMEDLGDGPEPDVEVPTPGLGTPVPEPAIADSALPTAANSPVAFGETTASAPVNQDPKRRYFKYKKLRPKEDFAAALKDYESMSTQELFDVLQVVNITMRDLQREYFEDADIWLHQENAQVREGHDKKLAKKVAVNPDAEEKFPIYNSKGIKSKDMVYLHTLAPFYEQPLNNLLAAIYGKEPRADPNMIEAADPNQKAGVVTRSRAAKVVVTPETEVLSTARLRSKMPAAHASRSGTPAPSKLVGRKRKGVSVVDEVAAKSDSSPEPEEERRPKRRRRGKSAANRDLEEAAVSTPEPAGKAVTPIKVGRKRGRKPSSYYLGSNAADEPVRKQKMDEVEGETSKPKRKLLTLKIPKTKNYSEPSSAITDNGDSRPSTASSDSSSHTADSSYSFRPKRQKRFRHEPDDGQPDRTPAKRRGKRASAFQGGDSYAAAADAALTVEPPHTVPRKTTKIKVVNKSASGRLSTPAVMPIHDDERPKDYKMMTKSEKMSASMKSRWANGNMAQAVEKRKATLAAKKAAQSSTDPKLGVTSKSKPKPKAAKKEAAIARQERQMSQQHHLHQEPVAHQSQARPTATEFIHHHHGMPNMGYP